MEAEIQAHLLVKPSPVLGLCLSRGGRFCFVLFCFVLCLKAPVGLAVALSTISLVQSQPLLPDLILHNLDLLKDNKYACGQEGNHSFFKGPQFFANQCQPKAVLKLP